MLRSSGGRSSNGSGVSSLMRPVSHVGPFVHEPDPAALWWPRPTPYARGVTKGTR